MDFVESSGISLELRWNAQNRIGHTMPSSIRASQSSAEAKDAVNVLLATQVRKAME